MTVRKERDREWDLFRTRCEVPEVGAARGRGLLPSALLFSFTSAREDTIMTRQEIEKRMDELARKYAETHDPKVKE